MVEIDAEALHERLKELFRQAQATGEADRATGLVEAIEVVSEMQTDVIRRRREASR
jgi:hypothetical protein